MKRFLRDNRKIIIVVCIILIFTVVYFTSWIYKNREREKAVIENGKLIVLTRYTESNTTNNQSTVLNAYLIENIHSSGFSKSFISRFQVPFTQPPGWCWEGEGQGYKWHNINELYRNNWQFLNYAKYGCWTFRFSFDESEKQLKTGKAEKVKFSNPTDILNMQSWKGQYYFFFKSHHCLYPLANDYQYEYNQFLHSFTDYIRKSGEFDNCLVDFRVLQFDGSSMIISGSNKDRILNIYRVSVKQNRKPDLLKKAASFIDENRKKKNDFNYVESDIISIQ